MASKKKKIDAGGVPEWLVTFADLMSILVCFFVLIISFSIQDEEKLQVVAGSMKDAFGIMQVQRRSGVIERDGNPERNHVKLVTPEEQPMDSQFAEVDHDENQQQGQEINTFTNERTEIEQPGSFNLATATLRQAWQELPDITNISDNLIVQDTEEGTNIVISDQEGRSMFPEASRYPYEVTRKALAAMAPMLARMSNPIRISGHTAAGIQYPNPRYTKWDLSADRANSVRQILTEFGVPDSQIFSVVGRADAEPLFPNAPYLAGNQRISILLVDTNPPVPAGLTP